MIDIIKRQVSEAAEDMASASLSQSDMERMLVALADEEAVRATSEGMATLGEKFRRL